MNRDIWLNDNFSDKNPAKAWTCPHCGTGTLSKKLSEINEIPNKETRLARRSQSYNAKGLATFTFSTELKCSNASCSEKTILSGRGEYRNWGDEFTVLAQFRHDRMRKFFPEYFQPHLKLIDIPDQTPQNVQAQLQASFPLYWIDKGACSNKLRVSLELLIDHEGIDRIRLGQNGKEHNLRLHDRIELFEEKYEGLGKLMEAVKWLGNEGSHQGDLKTNDILNAFEILETVLEDLYSNRKERIKAMADRINANKGTL